MGSLFGNLNSKEIVKYKRNKEIGSMFTNYFLFCTFSLFYNLLCSNFLIMKINEG